MPTLLEKKKGYSGACHSEHVELRRQLWATVFTVRLGEGRLCVRAAVQVRPTAWEHPGTHLSPLCILHWGTGIISICTTPNFSWVLGIQASVNPPTCAADILPIGPPLYPTVARLVSLLLNCPDGQNIS